MQKIHRKTAVRPRSWGEKAIIMTAKNDDTDNTENQAVDARWLWACTVINQEEDCFREM